MCLAGSLGCLSFYFRDLENASILSGRGKKIGYVQEMDQDVQRRPNDRMLWVNALPKRPIYEYDTIKTGPDSTVTIALDDNQSSFRISPNSLVVLDISQNGLEVRLASGDLFLKGKVKAKVGDRTVTASTSSEVKIGRRSDVGTLNIEVDQGAASIEGSDGKKTELQSGSQFTEQHNSTPKVLTLPMQIRAPESATILKLAENEKVPFEFEGLEVIPNLQTRLELSSNSQFTGPKKSYSVSESKIDFLIPHGVWYARLVDSQSKEVLSSITQFSIKSRPKLAWQLNRENEFTGLIQNEKTEFKIGWEPIADAANYKIEFIYGDQVLATKTVVTNHFSPGPADKAFVDSLSKLDHWQQTPWLKLRLSAFDFNSETLAAPIEGQLRFSDGRVSPLPEQIKISLNSADYKKATLSWTNAWTNTQTSDQIAFEIKIGDKVLNAEKPPLTLDSVDLFKAIQSEIEIRSVGKNGSSSAWAKSPYNRGPFEFASLVTEKATLIYPTNGSRFLKNSLAQTFVEWQLPKHDFVQFERAELKIEKKEKSFKTLVLKSKTNKIQLPSLNPGEYSISVQPYWKSYGASASSESREFLVIKGLGLRAPQIRGPAGN